MTSLIDGISNAFDINSHTNNDFELEQYKIPYIEGILLGMVIAIMVISQCCCKCCVNLIPNVKNKNLTYYLQMRNPKCNLFYGICMYIIYIYVCIMMAWSKPSTIIEFCIMTLFGSIVNYTIYLLYFSHYQQQSMLGGLQQQNINPTLFTRFAHYISYLMAQKKSYHENMCLSIMIFYNLFFISLCVLFKTLSFGYIYYLSLIMTPQIVMLNVMLGLMIHSLRKLARNNTLTSELSDIYHLRKQFNLTVLVVILPLDILWIILWSFPRYSHIVLTPFMLYSWTIFMYTTTRYPVYLQKKQEASIAIKAMESETWQDFLCEDKKKLFENIFSNHDDLEEIVAEINESFNRRRVSHQKLQLFLTVFALDPAKHPHSCLHEFLFVSEVMQIKHLIAKRNGDEIFTSKYGWIIDIPDGLHPSPILDGLEQKEEITAKHLYHAWVLIYERYIDENGTIQLYNLEDIEVLRRIYNKLSLDYPQRLCLDAASTESSSNNNDIHIDEAKNDGLFLDANNIFAGIDLNFNIDPNRFINFNTDNIESIDNIDITDINEESDGITFNYGKYEQSSLIDSWSAKFNQSAKFSQAKPAITQNQTELEEVKEDININIDDNISPTFNFNFDSQITLPMDFNIPSIDNYSHNEEDINIELRNFDNNAISTTTTTKFLRNDETTQIFAMMDCFDELLKWTHSRIESEFKLYKERQIKKIKKSAKCISLDQSK